jgi:PST family polysaccharide transporter
MDKVSFVFSTVMLAKALLFAFCLVVFLVMVLFIPKFSENLVILAAGFPIVLGWGLYPVFIYEGLQKVSVTALVDVLIKTAAAVLILALVNDPEDYYKVPMFNGAMQVFFGAAALIYALTKVKGLQFVKPKVKGVMAQLKDGQYVFFSNFFTTVYNFGTVIFGAFLMNPVQLGIFAAAYKLIVVANSFLFRPLLGALYPFLASKLAEGIESFKRDYKRSFLALGAASLFASLFVFFLSQFLLRLVFGADYLEGDLALKIMAPTLFIGAFIHMFLHQGLLHLRRDKQYMFLIISGGILSIILNIVLIKQWDIIGAALVRVVVDIYMASLAGVYFIKYLRGYGK